MAVALPKCDTRETSTGVWETDNISYDELYHLQREEFKEEFLEADDASDETRYIVQDGILHTMAPPYPEATPYPWVLLPHDFRSSE